MIYQYLLVLRGTCTVIESWHAIGPFHRAVTNQHKGRALHVGFYGVLNAADNTYSQLIEPGAGTCVRHSRLEYMVPVRDGPINELSCFVYQLEWEEIKMVDIYGTPIYMHD